MKLYNVTFHLKDNRTVLNPAIPETAGDTENKTIKRICLTDSIVHCVQALAHCNRNVAVGVTFLVREVQINKKDKALITPNELKKRGYVPDALENNEYWYTKPLEFNTYLCKIDSFDYEYELAWTCIEKEQCLKIVEKYTNGQITFKHCETAKEIYEIFLHWCNKNEMWDEYDAAWEELAQLPWAQKTGLYNFKYTILEQNNIRDYMTYDETEELDR